MDVHLLLERAKYFLLGSPARSVNFCFRLTWKLALLTQTVAQHAWGTHLPLNHEMSSDMYESSEPQSEAWPSAEYCRNWSTASHDIPESVEPTPEDSQPTCYYPLITNASVVAPFSLPSSCEQNSNFVEDEPHIRSHMHFARGAAPSGLYDDPDYPTTTPLAVFDEALEEQINLSRYADLLAIQQGLRGLSELQLCMAQRVGEMHGNLDNVEDALLSVQDQTSAVSLADIDFSWVDWINCSA